MLSSRRVSYKPRSRQYYKKKRINRKFSPALYKHSIPTYYQQKGRILQTTPYRMPIVPYSLPDYKTLDKMYQTLVKANYPGLSPSVQYNGYYFTSYSGSIADVFTFPSPSVMTSDVIDSQWLNNYVTNYIERPPLPDGYTIEAHIFSLNYDFPDGTFDSQWYLTYHSSIFSQDINLIEKSTSSTLSVPYYNIHNILSPVKSDLLRYTSVTFASTSIAMNFASSYTTSSVDVNTEYYPFIATTDPPLTDYLRVIRSTAGTVPFGNITFLIIFKYVPSI